MPQCVIDDGGTLKTSAADPCTGFFVLTPADYAGLNNSPLNLSAEDGFALSVAVVGVWACAFAARAVIRTLDVADGEGTVS